eukprot:gnl/MRDRNA2_/MRDRNA2_27271_c0_seq1.p1 gnl/MRDRNA2_/MRDRNA2_27271_c0~~gnl/MRDRNA2_/MRDRNA2_27271_c0_seq1.p1  ORF type:complete len:259 (+),score=32.80 gnl/MRDRNA2_/MRDRNA2_27271_c0_seq1:67-777(+)
MSAFPKISNDLPLHKSLVALEYDEEDVSDVLCSPFVTSEVLQCSVDGIPASLRDRLKSQLDALAQDTEPGNPEAKAVFSYGTLRGDFSPSGDRWGVISRTGAEWTKASVRGFKLYQDPRLGYPFVVHTGVNTDVVKGTLLTWPQGTDAALKAIAECDWLEGFREKQPKDGLYCRMVVDARVVNGSSVPTLIYYQEWPAEALSQVKSFPSGDWLRGRTSLPFFRSVLHRFLCGICGA